MKLTELKDKAKGTLCQVARAYLNHIEANGTLQEFMKKYEWDSMAELVDGYRYLLNAIVCDDKCSDKKFQQEHPKARLAWAQFNGVLTKANESERFPIIRAAELWSSYFSRLRLNANVEAMFHTEHEDERNYAIARDAIQGIYGLTDLDMEKLHFFIEQVKAGEAFPNSLRRMLYIWSDEKKTGKSTSATMLTCVLNGETDYTQIARYSSRLSTEMQIDTFAVPRISECRCVMMDECFYKDMGKTYANFKALLTSSNGRARLPYGQEFEWFGQPNYIATSNDPLKSFIKDYSDRRFLSINFCHPIVSKMDFPTIYNLWKSLCVSSKRTMEWQEWANALDPVCEEQGEMEVTKFEYEDQMRQPKFINAFLARECSKARTANANHITLRTFVLYFKNDEGDNKATESRQEIRTAAENLFGKPTGNGYWLLPDIQAVLRKIRDNEARNEALEPTNTDQPF